LLAGTAGQVEHARTRLELQESLQAVDVRFDLVGGAVGRIILELRAPPEVDLPLRHTVILQKSFDDHGVCEIGLWSYFQVPLRPRLIVPLWPKRRAAARPIL